MFVGLVDLEVGKIVVSIYDHGRKSNSAQGQEEKKLRKSICDSHYESFKKKQILLV